VDYFIIPHKYNGYVLLNQTSRLLSERLEEKEVCSYLLGLTEPVTNCI